MSKILTMKPRLSEKAYALSEKLNTYVFDLPTSANRHEVANATASQYGVGVLKVKIANTAARSVRTYKKRGRGGTAGTRAGVRKAYVTLKKGDSIPIFSANTEDKSEHE